VLGPGEITQPMRAQIREHGPRRRTVFCELVGSSGQQTCLPCAVAINRAVRFRAGPNQSPSRSSASPTCISHSGTQPTQ
jgi:hypothetical protein